MKRLFYLCGLLFLQAAWAQSPVQLVIDTRNPGFPIPADFAGLSFETGSELPNKNHVAGHLFSATNTPLITLFRNAGIHNLRVGGGTVDGLKAAVPSRSDIDDLFAFARETGNLKVIYSFRLLNGDAADAARTAEYIWRHYRPLLAAFSIGNEPDWKSFHYPPSGRGTDPAISDYSTYLAQWRKFAVAITTAAPGATFVGPDTGDYTGLTFVLGKSWTQIFADDEKDSGIIAAIAQHFYVGDHPEGVSGVQAVSNMLSAEWVVTKYPWLYEHNLAPVVADGLQYRLTESNDYLTGIQNASDSFAAALWALDYMHWWASHGCAGVNFHNKSWLRTDTVYLDSSGNYRVHPKAYALKAFEFGSAGHVLPLRMKNPTKLNIASYAVGSAGEIFLTLINKEHGAGARAASVTVKSGGAISKAAEMFLQTQDGNVAAMSGITLGGVSIDSEKPWKGQWSGIDIDAGQRCAINVLPASAVVVKLDFAGAMPN